MIMATRRRASRKFGLDKVPIGDAMFCTGVRISAFRYSKRFFSIRGVYASQEGRNISIGFFESPSLFMETFLLLLLFVDVFVADTVLKEVMVSFAGRPCAPFIRALSFSRVAFRLEAVGVALVEAVDSLLEVVLF
jgi:hypothetical protein